MANRYIAKLAGFFWTTIIVSGFLYDSCHEAQLIVAWWCLETYIWVNIGAGNGLLPEDTKPLPEPMLTYFFRLCGI